MNKPNITITQYSGILKTAQPITVHYGSNRRDAAKYLRSLRSVQRGWSRDLRIRVMHSAPVSAIRCLGCDQVLPDPLAGTCGLCGYVEFSEVKA